MILTAFLLAAATPAVHPGEEPVDPYEISDANAGAAPFAGDAMFRAFNGREGIDRIVTTFVGLNTSDPRISDIFKGQDIVRLNRTLREQFCYILGGGCAYTGRDMRSAHKDMGTQTADMNALVDNLQKAMTKEGVPFRAQNRFLAKLAPMKRDVVER
ncbi:group I truncated hemoglobin [Allosphingosinicella indica]|uniref:Hemoglobin n=1 Tax=Allosphingosinicella indica TaxID=941907 RepID=A0A1X7GBU2_9SPHN|nr:group 1 truncated hemoglobin [Allosphingosinicella indica]SMF67430.1 hemoglobin [Allosphingosinicella indica]